ncbi:hypothetical protein NDU88_005703 [Pleurodeles waltl]|uniref:Uncharacterized protein n=1 Tax=Pleurodeles waltl TaxID=8319 RepID=A0AAV7PJN4_PLEWA|nr:hypothetical protein NDU88_005703 [Pleurodeles waltl]
MGKASRKRETGEVQEMPLTGLETLEQRDIPPTLAGGPTLGDILQAITASCEALETKIDSLGVEFGLLKDDHRWLAERVTSVEREVADIPAAVASTQVQLMELVNKLDGYWYEILDTLSTLVEKEIPRDPAYCLLSSFPHMAKSRVTSSFLDLGFILAKREIARNWKATQGLRALVWHKELLQWADFEGAVLTIEAQRLGAMLENARAGRSWSVCIDEITIGQQASYHLKKPINGEAIKMVAFEIQVDIDIPLNVAKAQSDVEMTSRSP